jgi:PAS domain S-box-containing protein
MTVADEPGIALPTEMLFPASQDSMAALIHARDWSATSLGPAAGWSGTLKSTLSLILEAPLPMALLWGEDGVLIYNDAYADFAGDRHPSLLGLPIADAWPEAAGFNTAVLKAVFSGGKLSYADQHFALQRGGQPAELWLDLHYSAVRDRLDRPVGVLCVMMETTSRVVLEQRQHAAGRALLRSEAQLQALTAALPQLIWTADAAGRYDFFNERWHELTGLPTDTTDVAAWLSVVHPDDRETAAENWRRALETGNGYQTEYRLRRQDGSWRWFLRRALPVRDGDGEVIRWLGTCTDIEHTVRARDMLRRNALELEARVQERSRQLEEEQRERQKAEIQLRQAQKMEAIGNLTGGVAHDFNNLLQVIHGSLELLARDTVAMPRAARRIENALMAVNRGARLAAQLLAFGRRQPLQPKVVNIGRFVSGLDDMLRRSLGEAIEIETVIAAGLWNTLVDPGQVENALLNLAINARDAMEGRGDGQGHLTIEAGNATLDAAYTRLHPDAEPGQYVMLAVTDTGSGMPPEIVSRVFEPFFTTKPEGKGTGLGLSMVYGFVRQSGGHVKIYSEMGQGTTIKLYLPRAGEDEDQAAPVPSGPPAGGTETVLVVEDDDAVRQVVVETLTELGYKVLRARDAQSALMVIESGVVIDLIFTDVVMPGPLRSTELVSQARALQPHVAVLFTSGYTENSIMHDGRLDAGVDLLSKPYTREALAQKFRHVLADQAQRNSVAAGQAGHLTSHAIPPVEAPAGLSILLVEDDALIREGTRDILDEAGYQVCAVGDAHAALEALHGGRFDVLLTDIGLPGLSGGELAARAQALAPGIGVVFATGYQAMPELHEGLRDCSVLLTKPYDARALLDSLRHAVRPRRP